MEGTSTFTLEVAQARSAKSLDGKVRELPVESDRRRAGNEMMIHAVHISLYDRLEAAGAHSQVGL